MIQRGSMQIIGLDHRRDRDGDWHLCATTMGAAGPVVGVLIARPTGGPVQFQPRDDLGGPMTVAEVNVALEAQHREAVLLDDVDERGDLAARPAAAAPGNGGTPLPERERLHSQTITTGDVPMRRDHITRADRTL